MGSVKAKAVIVGRDYTVIQGSRHSANRPPPIKLVLSPGTKCLMYETYHSHPSIAEVKNAWT
jgi:hypothetical protein